MPEPDVWKTANQRNCPKCRSYNVRYRVEESSCGGYDDEQYQCRSCGYEWWVESSDA